MYFLLNILTLLSGNYISVKIEIGSTPAQTSTSGQETAQTRSRLGTKHLKTCNALRFVCLPPSYNVQITGRFWFYPLHLNNSNYGVPACFLRCV